jgi:hypothetical protein
VEVEFLHEVGAVLFYGLDADAEQVSNVLVLVTFCNQFQDFPSPLGQRFLRETNRGRLFPLQNAVDDRT